MLRRGGGLLGIGPPQHPRGPRGRPWGPAVGQGSPAGQGPCSTPGPPPPHQPPGPPAAGQGTHSAPKGHSCIRSRAPATGQRPPRQVRGPLQQPRGAPEPPQGAPHGRPWATVADQGGTAAGQGPPQPPIGGPEALPKYEGPKDHLQELAEQQRSSTRRLNARNPATNPQTPIGSGAPKPARGASGPPGPPLGYASF